MTEPKGVYSVEGEFDELRSFILKTLRFDALNLWPMVSAFYKNPNEEPDRTALNETMRNLLTPFEKARFEAAKGRELGISEYEVLMEIIDEYLVAALDERRK